MAKSTKEPCPCGSGKPYEKCCGPYITGAVLPPTAEALMRSRYTAYTLLDEKYLLDTWHSHTRPAELGMNKDKPTQWIGLDVKKHEMQDETHATVEFVTRYRLNGKAHKLGEVSRFTKENGRWLYVHAVAKAV